LRGKHERGRVEIAFGKRRRRLESDRKDFVPSLTLRMVGYIYG
jgi:hypothetical protein